MKENIEQKIEETNNLVNKAVNELRALKSDIREQINMYKFNEKLSKSRRKAILNKNLNRIETVWKN